MEHLIHTRDLLNSSLYQSRQVDFEIYKTSANLSRISHTFPSLETAIKNMASQCAISDHVHRALPPVSAVLNVYNLVSELGTLVSSSDINHNLTLYVSLVKRYRRALTLLTSTCRLAILWVQDAKLLAQGHLNVCKTLHLLQELQHTEDFCLQDQGILGVAFRALKYEFENLLVQNSLPIQVPSSLFSSSDEESDVSDPLPLPQHVLPFWVVQDLKAIVACFSACDKHRVDQCMSMYVKVRITSIETSLQGIDLDYLEISLSEFDSVQDIEGYIDEWGRHLEFTVKRLLGLEYTLCHQLFGEQDLWIDCFSKIALQSGIQGFIKFGNTITKAKKEAIKLFKLLDVFATLNNLRHDFNRFFGGKHCLEIQTQTRDLIKKVINGTFEIFHELSTQVQVQKLMDPPPDGSVPRLVSFVTEYSEELLDDDYRPVLDQVLEIHSSWYNASKGLVSAEVHNIIKSLEMNLETWAKRYDDTALSCIFIMNTSCYLSKHVKGTRLGDLMGESWLKRHEDRVEYYEQVYLRESWGKIPALLTKNERMMAIDVKNRIKGFTEAFEEEYKKQWGWVLCDNSLRWRTCRLIVEVIVPVYKSYIHKYLGLVEGSNKYVKYSSESLEDMVTSMLQPKYVIKCTNLLDRIKSVVAGRLSPTSTAA